MAYNRFGVGMIMVGVVVVDAFFQKVAETTLSKLLEMSDRHVAAQLIDSDLHDEFWLALGCGSRRHCAQRANHQADSFW